jgi:Tfp pilus assembly protein PilP
LAQAQTQTEEDKEVLRIWLEPQEAAPTVDSTSDDDVFSASDDYDPGFFRGTDRDDQSWTTNNKPAIETLATDDLTLVAVIIPSDKKDQKNKVAMVDCNGSDYELKEGYKLGKNNGFVKEITEDSVLIEETYLNDSGEEYTKEILLRLPE